ncbi:MAG: VWA domain-containing protein [Hyphomicrobiaceae bacterium]|nr:VWA domain-containing protein [Hyphomicrobiaceae bacterium]
MLIKFFLELRDARVPVSLREYLSLMQALDADRADRRVEDFYYLARATLVKDERYFDRFDQVFGTVFKGLDLSSAGGGDDGTVALPDEWLRAMAERHLSPEEMAEIQALGGWDKLMETLRQRLAEQKGRHQGGNKWIGTGGTSPFGAYGYNPEGVRIGQHESRHRRAVKVWDRREFRDLDETRELGTRSLKVALRKLRRFARSGAAREFDLEGTIGGSARQGYLDIQLRPERRNAVKVLMLLDVGGSMDDHVKVAEDLFSAARSEFKHLEHYYFHNCLYERVWKENARRYAETIPTSDLLRTYPPDYKVVFVGDASMSPYEITVAGGSVEHMNPEPGAAWVRRVGETWRNAVWLNPVPEEHWAWTPSIGMIQRLMGGRMYPMSLDGLDRAIRELMR